APVAVSWVCGLNRPDSTGEITGFIGDTFLGGGILDAIDTEISDFSGGRVCVAVSTDVGGAEYSGAVGA
ncbi:MAG: hypothetical protein ACLP2X_16425, partial [Syntrophobacteraceae bacterium]